MKPAMKWVANKMPKGDASSQMALMAPGGIEKARAFHRSFPRYRPTPLLALPNLAAELGVKNIFVKDESFRFGLNAFKVLGGS